MTEYDLEFLDGQVNELLKLVAWLVIFSPVILITLTIVCVTIGIAIGMTL